MTRLLPLLLAGCFVSKTMPPEEPCDQTVGRYSQRLLACTHDPDLATAQAKALAKAHTCAITGWNVDTGFSPTHHLELKGDERVSFHTAWGCSEAMAAVDCATLAAADPAGPFLYELAAGCSAIFDGPGDPGTWADTGLWYY